MNFLDNALPCRDEDPELFFVTGPGQASAHQLEAAKAVCRRCPVAAACGEWALSTGQDFGVWGGLSEDERRAVRRARTARRPFRTAGDHGIPSHPGTNVTLTRAHEDSVNTR